VPRRRQPRRIRGNGHRERSAERHAAIHPQAEGPQPPPARSAPRPAWQTAPSDPRGTIRDASAASRRSSRRRWRSAIDERSRAEDERHDDQDEGHPSRRAPPQQKPRQEGAQARHAAAMDEHDEEGRNRRRPCCEEENRMRFADLAERGSGYLRRDDVEPPIRPQVTRKVMSRNGTSDQAGMASGRVRTASTTIGDTPGAGRARRRRVSVPCPAPAKFLSGSTLASRSAVPARRLRPGTTAPRPATHPERGHPATSRTRDAIASRKKAAAAPTDEPVPCAGGSAGSPSCKVSARPRRPG
jgi:hypothetical protein